MKEPRFLREYISYKAKEINNNPFWTDERKAEAIEKNQKILRLWKRGLLTIDETLAEIARNY